MKKWYETQQCIDRMMFNRISAKKRACRIPVLLLLFFNKRKSVLLVAPRAPLSSGRGERVRAESESENVSLVRSGIKKHGGERENESK